MSLAEKLLEELRGREDLRRALAEELLPEVLRDRRLRAVIAASVLREVATRDDLARLGERVENSFRRIEERLGAFVTRDDLRRLEEKLSASATKEDLRRIEERLGEFATKEDLQRVEDRVVKLEEGLRGLEQRIARLEGMLGLFTKLFVAFNLPVLLGIIGILLKMVLG